MSHSFDGDIEQHSFYMGEIPPRLQADGDSVPWDGDEESVRRTHQVGRLEQLEAKTSTNRVLKAYWIDSPSASIGGLASEVGHRGVVRLTVHFEGGTQAGQCDSGEGHPCTTTRFFFMGRAYRTAATSYRVYGAAAQGAAAVGSRSPERPRARRRCVSAQHG